MAEDRKVSRGPTNLPEDLLFHSLLPKLPVKSLIRFKSVSKSWRAMTIDPNFIAEHLRHQHTTSVKDVHLLAIGCDPYSFSSISYRHCEDGNVAVAVNDLHIDLPALQILHCNGVLCFHDFPTKDDAEVMLWNPATRDKKVIATPSICSGEPDFGGIGFGYDPEAKDYKIVRILYLDDYGHRTPPIEVYSLASDSWKELDPDSSGILDRDIDLCSHCYLNGASYWLDKNGIASFDYSKEEFLYADLPVSTRPALFGVFLDSIVALYPSSKAPPGVADGDLRWYDIWKLDSDLYYNYEDGDEDEDEDLEVCCWSRRSWIATRPCYIHLFAFAANGDLIAISGAGKVVSQCRITQRIHNIYQVEEDYNVPIVVHMQSLVMLNQR